jgi:hypothetical protein
MARFAALGFALYSLLIGEAVPLPAEAPLPRVDLRDTGPLAAEWRAHHASVSAEVVHLNGLGVRTHANWVLFRLPFDTRQRDRIRNVRFAPTAKAPTEVGAIRVGGGICVTTRPSGQVQDWAEYTTSGIGGTHHFAHHPAPPTDDPTIYGINVPTRVANHVACGRDDRLRDPSQWQLDIDWEAR